MRPAQYLVLAADSIEELESIVEKCLLEGWVLQGGVAVERLPNWDSARLYQAMTHEEPAA